MILRYIWKNSSSSDKAIKRAIAKNLLFLSLGALLSISNAVIYPTVFFFFSFQADAMDDLEVVFNQYLASNLAIDIIRSASSLYSSVVTIILLKPVRDAIKQLIKCKRCKLQVKI